MENRKNFLEKAKSFPSTELLGTLRIWGFYHIFEEEDFIDFFFEEEVYFLLRGNRANTAVLFETKKSHPLFEDGDDKYYIFRDDARLHLVYYDEEAKRVIKKVIFFSKVPR
ncbi:MAG: hypothetical protein KatS3mg083_295 [Candidatus Dojkabacteria bacterium]|nr:MAG: hypothetical protein KatS3mg083_295 [Candidatus Dojkabacteria bacterium]